MDWKQLIIPLIAVAVWILSNLANQKKETRPPLRPSIPPRPQRDRPDTSEPMSRPEEENRYREEMGAARKTRVFTSPSPTRPATCRPEKIARPQPRVVSGPPALPGQSAKQELPLGVLVAGTVVSMEVQVTPPVPVPITARSVAVKNVFELLQKRESLATAFLLKEVLDLPLAKRSRRGSTSGAIVKPRPP